MHISVSRVKINKNEENKVTSHIIFEPHRRQKKDNLKLHKDGIFSKRIFGNLYRCDCGDVSGEGLCKKCETRVLNPKQIPDFYIDLTTNVPRAFADYESSGFEDPDIVSDIMNYKKFLYIKDDESWQVEDIHENINIDEYDQSKILIGTKALKFIGISDEWIEENTVDYLSIPHTSYRPLVIQKDKPLITNINLLYSNIIKLINDTIEMHEYAKDRPFYLMVEYASIVNLYNEIIQSLIDELQNVRYSIIKSEIISHPISGAVRAVLTNRHDVHEDVLIVGDHSVETLWPYLYEKYGGDMAKINEALVDGNYVVLLNRPPTIGHLSIIAAKPRIASIYPWGKIEGTKGCLLHNYAYVNSKEYAKTIVKDDGNLNYGDIEGFVGSCDAEGELAIDTLGVRCIGCNPIVFDGLASDVDGDVLLVIALYSKSAINQAHGILPSKSFMNYANGTIRNHIIEDFIFTDGMDDVHIERRLNDCVNE